MNIIKVRDSYGGTEIAYYCKDSIFNEFGKLTPLYLCGTFIRIKQN